MKQNQVVFALVLVALAVISRVLCAEIGAFNFAPVIAIGLVSGMLIRDAKLALVVALSGQFLADVFFQAFPTDTNTGFYGLSQFFVYGGLLAATLVGRVFEKVNVLTVAGGTLMASLTFFIISNLGYFAQGYNGYTAGGLVKTFADAIPFFKSSLTGDLIGSAVLFSAYFAVKFAFPARLKTA
ncbi:DUF6580 family putative transport protein [Rurimicrobium arvi]|uniref:Biotin transporter n=1 Tax=Rurimicrobium arvi TaxID=2049916 RepID=A0ABP8MX08_9BACT